MREMETINGKRNKFWTHLMRHHSQRECGVGGRGEGVCGVEEGWDVWGVVWGSGCGVWELNIYMCVVSHVCGHVAIHTHECIAKCTVMPVYHLAPLHPDQLAHTTS